MLDEIVPDWRRRDCYACGPQSLLAALEDHWSQAGLAHRMHVERFHAALARPPAGVAGGRVRFVGSGLDADADGSTPLLRVAEAAGLNPAHGCRMGICHTCTATLVAGCVRDVRDNRLTSEPGTKVQICVSAAAGNCALEL
jgi:ferredoxin